MISEELQKIVDRISAQGEMNFLNGATEKQIADYEEKNHISLPIQYKDWLRFSDGGECFLPAGVQLYGIAHKPIIDTHDNDRPNADYIVIGTIASGDPILFKQAEERIFIYNHSDARIENDEIYEDFYAFLRDMYDMLGVED